MAFYSVARFPNVLGATDYMHATIKASSLNEEAFVNRKGIHKINVQAVCDAEMKTMDIIAKWPGRSHDTFIWRMRGQHDY